MNTGTVISLEAVADLLPYRAVKMTATGVDYAGAADEAIGFTLPGDLNRNYPSVQLHGSYIEATAGNATAIVRGDLLEGFAGGKYVKRTAGTIIGVAVSASGATDDVFEAIIYRR